MTHHSQSEKDTAGETPQVENGKPPKTAGRHVHNELTYRGVDLFLNSTIGVTTTYLTERTEIGQRWFAKPVSNFFTKLLTPVLKTPAKIAEGARWGSMFTSIIVGGAAIIPPMVVLEKKENKKAIIRFFDEIIYGKKAVENDPRFKACHDAVDDEPHKGFWTGMAARFAVLTPMILATINPDINKRMVKYLYNPIAKGSKALAEGVGIKPKSLIKRGVMEIADGDISKAPKFVSDWDFIHRTIGFDLGLTAIYAFAHEFTYKAFAGFLHESTNGKELQLSETPPSASEPVASTHARWAEKHPHKHPTEHAMSASEMHAGML